MAKSLNITIDHLFPVRGHSYNQCDLNFGRYVMLLKSLNSIETAGQYMDIMSSARKNPSQFFLASYLIEEGHKSVQTCF